MDPGLSWAPSFDPQEDVAAPMIATGRRPRVAVLREQGVNSQLEMAAALERAGFAPVDLHMTDLLGGRASLERFDGLVACGGFSYGDVLGAGEGWAKSILFNDRARAVFSAWFERLGRGDFDLSISWSQEGATPYPLYQGLLSQKAVMPVGEAAMRNWHRFGSAEADVLLARFEQTTDAAEQRLIVGELQRIFAEQAPAIPLFPSPAWGVYNDERIVGWPNAENPYAALSPNRYPDPLLVMVNLEPRPAAVAVSP
jgi:hypothetical protein